MNKSKYPETFPTGITGVDRDSDEYQAICKDINHTLDRWAKELQELPATPANDHHVESVSELHQIIGSMTLSEMISYAYGESKKVA